MKKNIEIIAGETAYASLMSFETVEQLNQTVRQYKSMINAMELRQDLKRNLLTVMEYLKRHSCKFFGVSFKGKRKIAADLEMSDKTITRLCKRLEVLGFIKQYAMKRSNDMQQTSNAIVIQPAKTENVRQKAVKMSDQKNNIFLKQNQLLNNTYSAKSVTFYQRFRNLLENMVGQNQSLTSRLYGVYRAHSTALVKHGAFDKQDVENVAMTALHTAVMRTKKKKIRNLAGFYNGVLNKMLDRFVLEDCARVLVEEA
jgi:DNA-binding Lrp family transcriptional regulator